MYNNSNDIKGVHDMNKAIFKTYQCKATITIEVVLVTNALGPAEAIGNFNNGQYVEECEVSRSVRFKGITEKEVSKQ